MFNSEWVISNAARTDHRVASPAFFIQLLSPICLCSQKLLFFFIFPVSQEVLPFTYLRWLLTDYRWKFGPDLSAPLLLFLNHTDLSNMPQLTMFLHKEITCIATVFLHCLPKTVCTALLPHHCLFICLSVMLLSRSSFSLIFVQVFPHN